MNKLYVLPLKLFLITLIAGLLLGVTNMLTKEPILAQRAIQAKLSRSEALPGGDFELIDEEKYLELLPSSDSEYPKVDEIYLASKDGKPAGYVLNIINSGYNGEFELIVGIGIDKHITGITIGKHSETAGLGANATKASYKDKFRGKLHPVLVKIPTNDNQEVVAITGATITSQAVTDGVNYGVDIANKLIQEME